MAGSIVGAAVGGLLGGGDKTQTATNRPYLPEEYEEGYDRLLADALEVYERPRRAVEKTRVNTSPQSAYDQLFASPELTELQARSDKEHFDSILTAPVENAAAEESTAVDALRDEMLGRDYINGLSGQKGYYNVDLGNYDNKTLAEIGGLLSGTNYKGGNPTDTARYGMSGIRGLNPDDTAKLGWLVNTPRWEPEF